MTNTTPGIESIIENPNKDETVTLIVTVTDTQTQSIHDAIADADGDIEEKLPFNCLAVTTPEHKLKELKHIDGITEMEIESVFSGAENHTNDYAGYPPGKAVEVNPTAEEVFDLNTDT